MRWEHPGRRWAAAWTASALLHALLLALLWRVLPGSPPPPPAPIEVTLLPAAPGPRPAPPEAVRRADRGDGARGAAASVGPAAGGAGEGARAAPPAPHGADPRVRRWFAERGLGPAPDLRARAPAAGTAGARGDVDAPAEEGVAALAARRAREVAANARAADLARYPDESWSEERRRLADGFAPGTGAFDGVAGSSAQAAVAGDWMDAAGRYALGGPPWPPAPDPEPTARERGARTAQAASIMPAETHAFFDAQAALAARAEATPSRRLTSLVAVEHDAEARVGGVRLVATSGSARHDREALERARRLVGSASAPRFRSCVVHWAFVTELFVSSLRREARSRVELVAVYGG